MGFLDNSGDIILDAVLTDTGRFRLAKGDGSFRIIKFALGDDEINYGLYNKDHASGSAYYDLEIMQTPVLESFTNNTATMNSKLVTIPRTNLLYLPVLKINANGGEHKEHTIGGYVVAVDSNSEESNAEGGFGNDDGVIRGASLDGGFIRIDQGIDNNAISPSKTIDEDLIETQYIIEMDNRFGNIVSPSLAASSQIQQANVNFIDDDNIASYFVSTADRQFVTSNTDRSQPKFSPAQVLDGPRGTVLMFSIGASIDLNTSDYLFDQLGNTWASGATGNPTGQAVKYIDTIVRVTGATTGYRIDVPVRFVKVPT